MKRYLCYILLQILCICLLPIKGQSTNADVVVCKNPNASSYTSSFTYQAFSPIDIQAKAINGSLGGVYANDYHYDKQYRLIQSDGNGGFVYTFKASYSPSGRMSGKSMMANNLVGDLRFGYDRKSFTHQPRTIYDPTEGTMECYWDANGNLSQIIGCRQNKARLHEWDEENRLRFVLGEKYAGYYGYDAKGERVYKLTGTSGIEQVNAGYIYSQAVFDEVVLYPNPYIVITPKGYTKHYYAGAERIATVLGGGGFEDIKYPVVSLDKQHDNDIINAFNLKYKNYDPFNHEKRLSDPLPTATIDGNTFPELDYQCNSIVLEHLDILSKQDMLLGIIQKNSEENFAENDVYYYHGDHLGSANWITETNGKPIQYIHYAPYGELIDNQRVINFDERYKFTGKERDAESGYDYFGARYYASPFSFWLSVDPLADKYPNISPYAYCTWNPVKFVDPDGNFADIAWDLFNVSLDAVSLSENIASGNVVGAIVDGICLLLDAEAVLLPIIPGGCGIAIKAYRTSNNLHDASNAIKKVKNYGKYLNPNGGNTKSHGGEKHNAEIDKYIQNLPEGSDQIRKNQTQVDYNGRKIGNNRPDVQYNKDGKHVTVEFDTIKKNGEKHKKTIKENDPNTIIILKTVEP